MTRSFAYAIVILSGLVVGACAGGERSPDASTQTDVQTMPSVVAELSPTQGNTVAGTVTFTDIGDGDVSVVGHVTGLPPGSHGFHVHEKGDCSAPDGTSAGGHFNPDGSPHGAPGNTPLMRHAGDLGNIEAGADSLAHFEKIDVVIALEGTRSISGLAVIVHAGPDDFTTQPTGAAGARLACGVIG